MRCGTVAIAINNVVWIRRQLFEPPYIRALLDLSERRAGSYEEMEQIEFVNFFIFQINKAGQLLN